jgi:hypothetical protein
MSSPTLESFTGTITATSGQVIPGQTITVLSGQTDTVDDAIQPGTPLATIYADPYGNSQIPQAPVSLSGTVATVAGSPNVTWESGNPLSEFLEENVIVINGVQYTVAQWNSATSIVLATNALSTGTFAYSATIPVDPLVSDGNGNYQFWAAAGYYVLQIYGPQLPAQFILGISIGGSGGGGGIGTFSNNEVVTFSGTTGTLAFAPNGNFIQGFRNGVAMNAGVDFTRVGAVITLAIAAVSGVDSFVFWYTH